VLRFHSFGSNIA
jgi:hypothetical protein